MHPAYADAQFNRNFFLHTVDLVARELPVFMKEIGATGVAVRGKSGMSIAFATLVLIDFPLIVSRDPNVQCHGDPVEYPDGFKGPKYIFLDDFISSGETLESVEFQLRRHHNFELVGIMEYSKDYSSDKRTHPHTDLKIPTMQLGAGSEYRRDRIKKGMAPIPKISVNGYSTNLGST